MAGGTGTFMGDTSECFTVLAQRHPKEVIGPLLAEFCGVTDDTVRRWLNQGKMPVGEGLLKLRTFLHLAGYTVDELVAVPRTVRDLIQVVGLGVRTPEQVREYLGYENIQDVYRVLIRGEGIMSTKRHKVDGILGETEDELKRRRAGWQARIEDSLGIATTTPATATPSVLVVAPTTVGVSNEPLVVEHLIAALSAVLDNGNQGRGPNGTAPKPLPERRVKAIREYVDEQQLNRLCAQLEMLR